MIGGLVLGREIQPLKSPGYLSMVTFMGNTYKTQHNFWMNMDEFLLRGDWRKQGRVPHLY